MPRLLLTGASGFVGAHVLEHVLVNTDWEVVCPVSFRHQGTAERLGQVLGYREPDARKADWPKRVRVWPMELSLPPGEVAYADLGHIDWIWNVASASHVDTSITDPRPFVENNVGIALTMAEIARRVEPEIFLQMSTDEVYGPALPGQAHVEWEAIKPSNPYSASKACQEAILFSYWRTYGIPLVVTNTMNIVGEMQDPEKFVPKVMRSVRAGVTVPIHASVPTVGAPTVGARCWLHARNLADAWLWLTRTQIPQMFPVHDLPLRFNIVGEERTNLEIAQLVAEYLDRYLDYELVDFHSSRPGHDLRYALDGTSLASLGWKAPIPLEASLWTTVEWTRRHPEWLAGVDE